MKVPSNKISDIFRYYKKILEELFGSLEAKSFLYALFEHYLDIHRLDIAKNPDIRLNESELLKIHFAVKELLENKPIQYIIGNTNFCGFDFKVSPEVLIPRPETEELVEMIVNDHRGFNKPISILDVGTGSGCIAISLYKKMPESIVCAIDISEGALQIATENANMNHAKIEFNLIDILNTRETSVLPKFDILVANPPYIRDLEKIFMQKNVLDFEPENALFVKDNDPLIFYRSIAVFGQSHLNDKGRIYFETNEAFGPEISNLLEDYNYSNIGAYKDFRGKDRFVSAVLLK